MSAARHEGALVLGGGLAGAAAAIWLARAGLPVRLWEKERGPAHKICGEFLSWEAQAYLSDLGLDLQALGAVAIDRVRLVTAERVAAARLGFTARSLTRRTLDAALLEKAAEAGARVERGVAAREILNDGTVSAGLERLRAKHLLLATGKQNLRGAARDGAGTLNGQLGFKSYLRLAPAERAELSGHVELILFRGGYAGLQLVERDAANLCFLVDPERWKRCGGDFLALLADLAAEVPHLAKRLGGAMPLLDRPLAISGVPYGFLHRPGRETEGFWRLGDQAAVIPSFAGDGMSLALHSARLATAALLTGAGHGGYYRRLERDVAGPLRRATWLQRLSAEEGRRRQLAGAAALLPGLLRLGARWTRLSPGAVRRGRVM
ncbi:electron transfer flavoprotein [Sandaracinobacter sp. RS1-74]|uniref:NAD(P)/FAD-dependent oxidoreductase n=1 Tax=Sandaracinobacteroides sayramensis TaxID=2913411 RepID=UPI001EDB668D|nr:electron transfer flavoprotein [Sandaracinobacteroides sayramensis]MCG2842786.1 electron transfer flavoprotein [Sandaracinobacteroides sayramensis]